MRIDICWQENARYEVEFVLLFVNEQRSRRSCPKQTTRTSIMMRRSSFDQVCWLEKEDTKAKPAGEQRSRAFEMQRHNRQDAQGSDAGTQIDAAPYDVGLLGEVVDGCGLVDGPRACGRDTHTFAVLPLMGRWG